MSVELYSFDVFDTLLTRTTASPKGIFAWIQRELCKESSFSDLPSRFRENFFCLRIQGEAVARNTFLNDAVMDITLAQIYRCIGKLYDLTETQAQRLMELEIQAECKNSIPIRENIDKVKQLLAQKKRVVLVTNMYLPEKAIRQLLVQADPIFENMQMYVSGELGKTKGTCTLYHYVKQLEKVEFARWEHFGDNKELDVEIPCRLNMRAVWYQTPEYLPWEQSFLKQREDNLSLQLLIGASLRARRGREADYPYMVGAGYGGPLLYPYVEWVLGESLKRGIRRLFFIARDGYILKKMADIIILKQNLAIETFYLYGSRKAWRLPSVTPEHFDMEEFLLWNYPGQIYSYEGIAEMFEMSLEELGQLVPFSVKENVRLSVPIRQEVFRILTMNQKGIASYVQSRQKEKRERVLDYLKEALKTVDHTTAFVDLIGSGYTQKCLADLLSKWTSSEITTFFYRLDSCRSYEKSKNYAFYGNRLKMGNVIEVLCGANHGQTVDYRQHNGRWEPVCEEDEGQAMDAYGFQNYLEGILAYTQEIGAGEHLKKEVLTDLCVPGLYFDFMANAEDSRLYEYIADMPYGIRGTDREVKCFAPRLSDKALRQIYLYHKGEPIRLFYSGYSLEFSLLRLSEKQKKKLAFYKQYSDSALFRRFQSYRNKRQRDRRLESKYDLIGDRIVLYGAGKRGQLLYWQLTEGKRYHAQIMLWVDRNYDECRKKGLDVWDVDKILECSGYKQVVIAVDNKEQAGSMKAALLELGVPEYRIFWIRPYKSM